MWPKQWNILLDMLGWNRIQFQFGGGWQRFGGCGDLTSHQANKMTHDMLSTTLDALGSLEEVETGETL